MVDSNQDKIKQILAHARNARAEFRNITFRLGLDEKTGLLHSYDKKAKDLNACPCGVHLADQLAFFEWMTAKTLSPCALEGKVVLPAHQDLTTFSDTLLFFERLEKIEATDVSSIETFDEILHVLKEFLHLRLLVFETNNAVPDFGLQPHHSRDPLAQKISDRILSDFKKEAQDFLASGVSADETEGMHLIALKGSASLTNASKFKVMSALSDKSKVSGVIGEGFEEKLGQLLRSFLQDTLVANNLLVHTMLTPDPEASKVAVLSVSSAELEIFQLDHPDIDVLYSFEMDTTQQALFMMLLKSEVEANLTYGYLRSGRLNDSLNEIRRTYEALA